MSSESPRRLWSKWEHGLVKLYLRSGQTVQFRGSCRVGWIDGSAGTDSYEVFGPAALLVPPFRDVVAIVVESASESGDSVA